MILANEDDTSLTYLSFLKPNRLGSVWEMWLVKVITHPFLRWAIFKKPEKTKQTVGSMRSLVERV